MTYLNDGSVLPPSSARKPVTLPGLAAAAAKGERLTMLTCYDASFAHVLDAAGVEILLIGDSLGMVLQGHDSTLPVTLEDVAYHTACVARAKPAALVMADMRLICCKHVMCVNWQKNDRSKHANQAT